MTEFAVWAPTASRVRLRIEGTNLPVQHAQDGWWRTEVPEAKPGTDYAFLLGDDDHLLPDPRSRWQPHGVHGYSRVYDHGAFEWTDSGWHGRQLPGAVLYELHIGTFTAEGTFDAAIERLDHLVDLGVDLVELLPVNAFNGEHNWGYDGVCWFAPHEPYGGPDGLKRLVDACHGRGLGVVLDVVYNHFGPSGAYAPMFGPYLAETQTSWGRSVNLDGAHSDEVRRYILDSVAMWLRDYHVDGLRLDAVHALHDRRAVHILEEVAVEVETLSTHLGRPLSLIAESDLNDPRLITPREAGGYGLTAQWADDVHHALHALLTGERQGYYVDFGALECLADVFQEVFWHAGTFSTFRGHTHGRPVDRERIPGHRFVAYLQNHDQIGNRAAGDRLSDTVDDRLLKVGVTLLFTGPFTPMLFMGEEWAAGTPWQFFTSHPEPDLARAVVDGRRAEFATHGWSTDVEVPDPQDPATFARSKLDWSELVHRRHRDMLDFYRQLIRLRKARPELSDPHLDQVRVICGDQYLTLERGPSAVVCNFAPDKRRVALSSAPRNVLLATDPGLVLIRSAVELPPHSAAVLSYV